MPFFYATFPANANFLITFLISVATFDLLPASVIPFFFDFPVKDSFNLAFQATGYSSMYSIGNLGTTFVMINVYIIQCVMWIFFYCFRNTCMFANKCHEKYAKALFWGTPIRILFEGYLELCLSIFVSMTDMEWEDINNAVLINNVFTIVMVTFLLALPIFIAGFYSCNVKRM